MFYLLLIILGIAADQLIKFLVAAKLPLGGGFVLIPHILQIHYVQNTGAAWSMFDDSTLLLAFFSVFMAIFLAVWFFKTPREKMEQRAALCLMISGAIGNMLDRFRLGYVIDFIELPHWPVFNVADILLCVGVALLAVLLLVEEIAAHKEKTDEKKDAE